MKKLNHFSFIVSQALVCVFQFPIFLVFSFSSGSLSELRNKVLRYVLRRFYRVVSGSVPVVENFIPSPGSLSIGSFDLLEVFFVPSDP